MKIYGGDNWKKGSWMKIHDGETEMPIDVWSMVVKIWNKDSWMKIHDGESEMPIDVWSMVVITESPRMKIHGGDIILKAQRWKSMVVIISKCPRMKIHGGDIISNAHRCLIYGGDNLKSPRMKIHGGDNWMKGDALNKMTTGGCSRQDDNRGMP